ncbi:MAG: hypothetical protein K9W46_08955 [Candidatus Heimdallarchaeum endolithica]|uniref:Uncharacterized protein n=1 Tax=Candidatus Heimdallarchaeum endolithica TaxID=2876572 RepID=A0A9Y1BNX8_9ARCH|nr:MAG: hypothetical protein K9W46_08955 [Candidatus Heimdallarchaeum endolithica]
MPGSGDEPVRELIETVSLVLLNQSSQSDCVAWLGRVLKKLRKISTHDALRRPKQQGFLTCRTPI